MAVIEHLADDSAVKVLSSVVRRSNSESPNDRVPVVGATVTFCTVCCGAFG